jgi:hypothetical protein
VNKYKIRIKIYNTPIKTMIKIYHTIKYKSIKLSIKGEAESINPTSHDKINLGPSAINPK